MAAAANNPRLFEWSPQAMAHTITTSLNPMKSIQIKENSLLYLLALVLVVLLAAGIIYADILVLKVRMGEESLTEVFQSIMILLSSAFFAIGAIRQPQQRGYLIAVATLFLCMFIRENDAVLDGIWHGFWIVPVGLVVLAGAVTIWKNSDTVKAPFLDHADSVSFWIIMIGLVQLMIFTRLFGSGGLWENVPAVSDPGAVKTIVQEGTELVSYSFIVLGSGIALRSRFGAK